MDISEANDLRSNVKVAVVENFTKSNSTCDSANILCDVAVSNNSNALNLDPSNSDNLIKPNDEKFDIPKTNDSEINMIVDIPKSDQSEGNILRGDVKVAEVVEDFTKSNLTSDSTNMLWDVAVSNNSNALKLNQSNSKDLIKPNNNEEFDKSKTNDSEINMIVDIPKIDQSEGNILRDDVKVAEVVEDFTKSNSTSDSWDVAVSNNINSLNLNPSNSDNLIKPNDENFDVLKTNDSEKNMIVDIPKIDQSEGNILRGDIKVAEVVEDFTKSNSTSDSWDVAVSNNINSLKLNQSNSEDLMKSSNDEDFDIPKTNPSEIKMTADVLKNDQNLQKNSESSESIKVSNFLNSNSFFKCKQYETVSKDNERQSEAIVKVTKPLCADYKSDSDSESVVSENDTSTVSTNNAFETSSESEDDSDSSHDSSNCKKTNLKEGKSKGDLTLPNLPPVEDLRISVPEDACVDIGTITNIVDVLVVVESYKGTAALDLDTVLFLDHGKRTLGKVFDILGPITEPIYTIRFNSQEQINNCNIKKGSKVYFAPRTEHTNFVFMKEVLKNKGTDASWKDNVEAPPEFQDFSDDEEEKFYKNKINKDSNVTSSGVNEQNKSRKRSFSNVKQNCEVLQPCRLRNSNFSQRMPNFQRNPSNGPRPSVSSFMQPPPYPYNPSMFQPQMHFPPRFSGPPFPSFGVPPYGSQNQNFHRPFYQQRTHAYNQNFRPWGRPMFRPLLPPGSLSLPPPPPPPPPPVEKNDRQFSS